MDKQLTRIQTVLMVAPSAWPDKGGVETHLRAVSQELNDTGWQVFVLVPPKHRPSGKLGLVWLWLWMLSQLSIFLSVSVIHIHDVFLWFWPVLPIVKFIWFLSGRQGKIVTTFHGWEGTFPPTFWQKFNKWLADQLSDATIAVGDFLAEFYPIQPTKVTYGGVTALTDLKTQAPLRRVKSRPRLIFVGRLAADTGLAVLLSALKTKHPYEVEFWGEGVLKSRCAQFGEAKGWVENPLLWLQGQKEIEWVVASGYLSVLEALAAGRRVIVVADNPLKQAYYVQAPFKKYLTIVHDADELRKLLASDPSDTATLKKLRYQQEVVSETYGWDKVAKLYLSCYGK